MPAHQRDRRAHSDADAPRTREPRLNSLRRAPSVLCGAGSLFLALVAGRGTAAPAERNDSPPHEMVAPSSADAVSAAALDVMALYSLRHGAAADSAAAVRRLERGLAALHVPGGAGGIESAAQDAVATGSEVEQLLRVRVLEALAAALGRNADGLQCAVRAESLATALAPLSAELAANASIVVPLAAGLHPDRGLTHSLHVLLRDLDARAPAAGQPALSGVTRFWLWHVLAATNDGTARTRAPGTDEPWGAACESLQADVAAGRMTPFVADEPRRRLALAVRTLCNDGVLPPRTGEFADAAAVRVEPDSLHFALARAALDSLRALLTSDAPRATAILGSRHDYYRRPGQAAPTLTSQLERAARQLARDAVEALRSEWGTRIAHAAGLEILAEVEPVEVVPGQPARLVWSLAAAESLQLDALRARFGPDTLAVHPGRVTLRAGGSASVCTRYTALPPAAVGSSWAREFRLQCELTGWGPVEISDRAVLRVVAPVQASLTPVDDPLVMGTTKSVEFFVTSRAPHPIEGIGRVLATSDWAVKPAQAFRFVLRRPGQSARQQLDLALPALASPGTYELAVRLEVEGQVVGTVRTQLVKPMQWVSVGPFAVPAAGRRLPPENGVSIGTRYAGLDGNQVAWQAVPHEAYDPDGSLDLEAVYPALAKPACACAFTVIESPVALNGSLRAAGATRVWWNGEAVTGQGPVRIEKGRNVLLLRGCWNGTGGTLGAEVRDQNGEPLHVMINELTQLLDGYRELGTAAPRLTATGPPVDRVVLFRYHPAAASQEVAVLGSFNAWVPQGLERQPDGSWVRQLRLQPGRYAYKLLVDGRLRPDPDAAASEPDGFGGLNSLLLVR